VPGGAEHSDGDGPWPAVIMFPTPADARRHARHGRATLRTRLRRVGPRLLLPQRPYESIDMRSAFQNEESMDRIMAMMRGYTVDMALHDAHAFVDYSIRCPKRCRAASGPPATAWGVGCPSLRPRTWGRGSRHRLPSTAATSPKRTTTTVPPQSERHQGQRVCRWRNRGQVVS